MELKPEPPELIVPDAAAWRAWLEHNHATSAGVRLVLARRGGATTGLTHAQALDEALCFGWIDARAGRRDEATWTVRFQRRRPRSRWSERNTQIVDRLIVERRMTAPGLAEVERARQDGRWEAAYRGPATMSLPGDLAAALAGSPAAEAVFARLSSQNRYALLYRIHLQSRGWATGRPTTSHCRQTWTIGRPNTKQGATALQEGPRFREPSRLCLE